MTPQAMATEIEAWFGAHDRGGLELPSGWFGRPYDNFMRLSWIRSTGPDLVLRLDDLHELTLRSPARVDSKPDRLTVTGFVQGEWVWREYVSGRPRAEPLQTGAVTIWAAPGSRDIPDR
jgi:hypothetical protein